MCLLPPSWIQLTGWFSPIVVAMLTVKWFWSRMFLDLGSAALIPEFGKERIQSQELKSKERVYLGSHKCRKK